MEWGDGRTTTQGAGVHPIEWDFQPLGILAHLRPSAHKGMMRGRVPSAWYSVPVTGISTPGDPSFITFYQGSGTETENNIQKNNYGGARNSSPCAKGIRKMARVDQVF